MLHAFTSRITSACATLPSRLGDFTILIGPNDSGKSSFLEVIRNFGKLGQGNIGGSFQGDRA